VLHGIRSIAEWRLGDVARALSVIVDSEEVKSSVWETMVGLLGMTCPLFLYQS